LELADEGDLGDLISKCQKSQTRVAEEEVWSVVEQISGGLLYLHTNNVLHRDIKVLNSVTKPTNILCFNGRKIKISDFNVSKFSDHLSYTRTGTLSYASPEIWMGLPYDAKSDIWSFGCLLYELVCLRKPFFSESIEELYKKVTKCQFAKVASGYSRELRDLIAFMIQLNPKLRPSASTIHRMCLSRKNSTGKSQSLSRNRGNALTPHLLISLKESRFDLNHSSLGHGH
jgi:NIMA (never in mitosis gene a)-related kinase